MANIVELREMSNTKLEEALEHARDELFNLRFQKASARLENTSRVGQVRRELAQIKNVLHMRARAAEVAAADDEIAAALAGKQWEADVQFSYEDSAYRVEFVDEDGNELVTALVDLNKKRARGRKGRGAVPPRLVIQHEIAG